VPTTSSEPLHLPSSLDFGQPAWAIFHPQLATRLLLLQGVLVVERTAEDDLEPTERFCVRYFAQGTAAVAAEGERNIHAVFVRRNGLLRRAGGEFELVLGDQQADGGGAAGDFPAGKAMAEGLCGWSAIAGDKGLVSRWSIY
jgi:hypothetical protein